MNAIKSAVGMFGMLMANLVLAQTAPPDCPLGTVWNGTECVQPLPMDDVGLFAVAAVLLMTGIKIIRQKRSR